MKTYLVLNADMYGTPAEPGEHVDWSTPDVFTEAELEDLVEMPVAEYAQSAPHMIVAEVTDDEPVVG